MKIALVLFTKNELENSKMFFPKIPRKLVDSIYVIDGNSTDGTREFFQKKKIRIFGQTYKGQGGAYESTYKNVKEDAYIFIHPDGNMEPKEIKKFIDLLKSGHQFIIASRMIKGGQNEEDGQILKTRKWFVQSLAILSNIIWGRDGNKVSDVTQGYRAFTRNAYKKIAVKIPSPIACDFEQSIRALKKGIKITEFPTKEGLRVYGETSLPAFKAGKEHLRVLFKEIISLT